VTEADGIGTEQRADMPLALESPPVNASAPRTYGQILKSSALIGGSSFTTIALGIVRTKAMALLLGPAGVGLLGLYGSIADLAQSVVGLGINSSGVRQIAEAVGSGDTERIARTVTVLRRMSLLLGLLGGLLLVGFSGYISTLTFGTDHHASAVALLSVAVTLGLISAGQRALIQGLRRIPDLAMLGIVGAFIGTLITIPTVYFLGDDGVVPALVGVAATAVLTSWWYSRKVRIQLPSMTAPKMAQEAGALLKLGFAFMASGLMTMGVAYVVRIIVLRTVGFEATGLYQSAWALGGLYVGFILQAMGTDFYPRLTAVAKNDNECTRLVNEQAQVSLLLAGPGVLATLTFAPLVITLLYSTDFHPAVPLLRWICAGMALRVISWPMGFIILAKGEQTLFFVTELAWTVVHAGLAWVCVHTFGLNGAGIAFFGSYVFHACLIYPIVRRLSGFRWSAANRRTGLLFVTTAALVFGGFYVLSPLAATVVGSLALVLSAWYSVRVLVTLVPLDEMPPSVRRLLILLRFAPLGA